MNNQVLSPEARRVLTLGRERLWGFRVAEGFGVLSEETYKNGLWYSPTDSTQINKASKRIEAISDSGVKIRQVIVAHEAPMLLCAPPKPAVPNKGRIILLTLAGVVTTIGIVLAAFTLAMALLVLLAPLVMGMAFVLMLGLGVLIDPCLIVVLEDGTRIEILRWIE